MDYTGTSAHRGNIPLVLYRHEYLLYYNKPRITPTGDSSLPSTFPTLRDRRRTQRTNLHAHFVAPRTPPLRRGARFRVHHAPAPVIIKEKCQSCIGKQSAGFSAIQTHMEPSHLSQVTSFWLAHAAHALSASDFARPSLTLSSSTVPSDPSAAASSRDSPNPTHSSSTNKQGTKHGSFAAAGGFFDEDGLFFSSLAPPVPAVSVSVSPRLSFPCSFSVSSLPFFFSFPPLVIRRFSSSLYEVAMETSLSRNSTPKFAKVCRTRWHCPTVFLTAATEVTYSTTTLCHPSLSLPGLDR